MRVSFNSTYRNAVADINNAAERLAERQREVSSNVRVAVPSDDPSAEQRIITEQNEIGTLDRYVQAADSVGSRLSVVDSLFSDIITKITTARASASAATGSSPTQAQREATALNLEGLRADIFSDVTTKFRGTYLFSGDDALTAPYTQNPGGTVNAYQGSAAGVSVDIDRGRSVQVAFDADSILRGSAATDLFTDLTTLIADVRAGNTPGIATGLDKLEAAFDRVVQAQSRLGSDLRTIDDTRARLQTLQQAGTARVAKDRDANLAEAATGLAQADTAYRAAIGATANATRTSLLDYLR